MINYETWYNDEEQIYNGTSKHELINEIKDFIDGRFSVDEDKYFTDVVSEDEIDQLDEKALSKINIKLYFARWTA
ncbi:hypothetical protein KDN24_06395 [Bacillus sp. Bva_UNVM-123]|uniref:hypothetical protein n=1 Tax=Bacillus sp. Bva_UNVM-123 TaxID=2829798 RepID=UPI00391F89D0